MMDFQEANRRAKQIVDCTCGECTTVPHLWVVQPIYEPLLAMGSENYLLVPHEAHSMGQMIAGMAQRLDQKEEALREALANAHENLELAERGLEIADLLGTRLARVYTGLAVVGVAVLGGLIGSLVI